MSGVINLNLGCGEDHWGDVRVDILNLPNVTTVADLEKGLPFLQDNCVIGTHAYSIFEHIRNFIFLMDEIFRVSIDGATLKIVVPYWTWNGAVADPQHIRLFNEETWRHFCIKEPGLVERSGITHGHFKEYEVTLNPLPGQKIEDRTHKINIVHDMKVVARIGK